MMQKLISLMKLCFYIGFVLVSFLVSESHIPLVEILILFKECWISAQRHVKLWQLDPDLVDFKILTCKTRDCCNQGGHCPQITRNIDIAMEDIEMIEEKQLYKNILHTLKSSRTLFLYTRSKSRKCQSDKVC